MMNRIPSRDGGAPSGVYTPVPTLSLEIETESRAQPHALRRYVMAASALLGGGLTAVAMGVKTHQAFHAPPAPLDPQLCPVGGDPFDVLVGVPAGVVASCWQAWRGANATLPCSPCTSLQLGRAVTNCVGANNPCHLAALASQQGAQQGVAAANGMLVGTLLAAAGAAVLSASVTRWLLPKKPLSGASEAAADLEEGPVGPTGAPSFADGARMAAGFALAAAAYIVDAGWTQLETGRHEWLGHAVMGGLTFDTPKSLARIHVPQWEVLSQVPQRGAQAAWEFMGGPLNEATGARGGFSIEGLNLTTLGQWLGHDASVAWMAISGPLSGVAVHGAAAMLGVRWLPTRPLLGSLTLSLGLLAHLAHDGVNYAAADLLSTLFDGGQSAGDFGAFGDRMHCVAGGPTGAWTALAGAVVALSVPSMALGQWLASRRRQMPEQ